MEPAAKAKPEAARRNRRGRAKRGNGPGGRDFSGGAADGKAMPCGTERGNMLRGEGGGDFSGGAPPVGALSGKALSGKAKLYGTADSGAKRNEGSFSKGPDGDRGPGEGGKGSLKKGAME